MTSHARGCFNGSRVCQCADGARARVAGILRRRHKPRHPPRLPAASADKRRRAAPGQDRGGGGGRGNPAAALYTERCAGCHGLDMRRRARAPACSTTCGHADPDDDAIARNIMNGIPNTEMMPFKEQLTEPQIWQLVA